jgi:hypothetical protein
MESTLNIIMQILVHTPASNEAQIELYQMSEKHLKISAWHKI